MIVNLRTKAITQFEHRMPHPISLIQFAKHLPTGAEPVFFMLSKGGVYRVMNMQFQYQEIAKFHPSQFLQDFSRPLSLFIELENDGSDTLQYRD